MARENNAYFIVKMVMFPTCHNTRGDCSIRNWPERFSHRLIAHYYFIFSLYMYDDNIIQILYYLYVGETKANSYRIEVFVMLCEN